MSALAPSVPAISRPIARVARAGWLARGVLTARSLGPYAAIELLLPGGTLLAFLFWLYRRHRQGKSLRPAIKRGLSKVQLSMRRLIPLLISRPASRSLT